MSEDEPKRKALQFASFSDARDWLNEPDQAREATAPSEGEAVQTDASFATDAELRTHFWRRLSELEYQIRFAGLDEPRWQIVSDLLAVTASAIVGDELDELETLRGELDKINTRFVGHGLDGPDPKQWKLRMLAAAQNWIDENDREPVEPAVGVRWVAAEALSLREAFSPDVRANLEELAAAARVMRHGGTLGPESKLTSEAAAKWATRTDREPFGYVSAVLRSAGVEGQQVNTLFSFMRKAAHRARQRSTER